MHLQHLFKLLFGILLSYILFFSAVSAAEDARTVEVTQALLNKDISKKYTFTGTVTSPRRSALSSRTDGLITEINVDAGSMVKKGDVLMVLDAKLAELDLALIKTEIAQAEIELADAERLVAESSRLSQSGAFAKSETDSRKTMLLLSENKLKQLDARQSQLLEKIARHQLIAPFDGVISDKHAEAGEWVATGTPVLQLVEMKNLRFDLQVPQEFLAEIKNSGSVQVLLDAYPDRILDAKLAVIVPVKNDISRSFLTRLSLTDPEGLATPGMSGTVIIDSHSPSETIVQVPRDALVRFHDGTNKVWIVENIDSAPRVVSRIVKTAGELGKMAKVIEGLKGGETIILKGNEGLSEGQEVRILNPEKLQP